MTVESIDFVIRTLILWAFCTVIVGVLGATLLVSVISIANRYKQKEGRHPSVPNE